MARKRTYFGTDGVRGIVGKELSEDLVERLGRAFALTGASDVLVGRDTRASGPALERVLARGIASGGARVRLAGILPTPAVALLGEEAGAVISASHNPPEYNGVKFFRAGYKLSEEEEAGIEARLGDAPASPSAPIESVEGLGERYLDLVVERFGTSLRGLRIAVDCANGAFSVLAPAVFRRLGATVTPLATDPDGTNINVGCGATDLTLVSGAVRQGDFDLGVAFDGDGDRMLAVDAAGAEVDGDQVLAILALHLGVELVVVTEMTNLGFHRLMAERGVRVLTTEVGDRHVLEALRDEGGLLGGEQSGHLIYLEGHTTGDGLVAALLLGRAIVESEKSLTELAGVMVKFPQVKANVFVRTKGLPRSVLERIADLNAELGDEGRILVRPSGTEPVIRVLAEAEKPEVAASLCATIEHLVRLELG
jgi:phosphoglucosamine mutase